MLLKLNQILYVKFKAGLFENPYVDENDIHSKIHQPEHIALSKKMADEIIEKGLRNVSITVLEKLAIALNADISEFFKD